ncbi:MAG: hypothetical protein BLM47_05610 [Candidatus Reconcilbacillus cellulovorans]|mgnify:CR=1 FL=1|uniref:Uncharacterized protein n=1 Tax=Candidatus Reconcilbacillus cellulovorans TaxID=1906605 RepID=A0A2A6E1D6_9BACL|nr:MAG: hypothetical protein BLM47_05610 [Candidatus Reconcilbacillus cellulovorans]
MRWWGVAAAFLSGACMFSYWLGLLADKNLRAVGDGNPGAFNLWRAAGARFGAAGVVLDFLKGYLPVTLLTDGDGDGLATAAVALAPVAGHIFSPFLHFRGGKGVAVTFGVWSALTDFEVSLAYAVVLAVLAVAFRAAHSGKAPTSEEDALQIVGGMLAVGAYLWLRGLAAAFGWTWCGNALLLAFAHRRELRQWWGKAWCFLKGRV